jgi:hypothetical protein
VEIEEMTNGKFKVPCSSLSELKKIVVGYAHLEKAVDLTSLSKLVGIGGTTISPNNPFLAEVGLIDNGKAKTVTLLGKKLGRAIEHKRQEEVKQAWQEVVKNCEFLSNLVSTVRIKGGMSESDLASHILYVADLKRHKGSNTGANTIIAILKEASLLDEDNGKLTVSTSENTSIVESFDATMELSGSSLAMPPAAQVNVGYAATAVTAVTTIPIVPTIAINIQLQLPETENAAVYENLFKALRIHLLTPENEAND